ncbi:type II toxin-antitoxin system Phd/YefM family antitoxin [Thauera butanivorans]|jgi:prevent-host-death family protein|uniref:type II toxin-antitoxin system Phd/YefM family antitoxin n=1 Tax=Thauera butanivorans TaxID=86174 RepID=UPI0008393527|nr:type II toxin-antitoxin system prevent-host-death family antitoxin [Thauera butanivorans]
MITFTSVEAQNRFGELIDRSQREPVQVTRRGRVVAYVVSEHDMQEVRALQQRRNDAAHWYAQYRQALVRSSGDTAAGLTDDDINDLVHELR